VLPVALDGAKSTCKTAVPRFTLRFWTFTAFALFWRLQLATAVTSKGETTVFDLAAAAWRRSIRLMRWKPIAYVITFVAALSLARPTTLAVREAVFETSVAAHADEDVASDCRYELTLPEPSRTIRATWVIFERGRDIGQIYRDADVRAFARRNHLALLYPFHCAAKAYRDMDIDPLRGLGRGLVVALQQFAAASDHHELATSKLILLGFSGTGSLVARLAGYSPDRVSAVIATDPGHFDPLGVDTINLSTQAAAIPQLILVGSADAISGTQRPYAYFRKYFDRGSSWTLSVFKTYGPFGEDFFKTFPPLS